MAALAETISPEAQRGVLVGVTVHRIMYEFVQITKRQLHLQYLTPQLGARGAKDLNPQRERGVLSEARGRPREGGDNP
jgi:hypothetical protein